MKRILVTGGAGFIGSHVVRLLVRKGCEVLNLDKLTYAGNLSSIDDLSGASNHRFIRADICEADRMAAIFADFRPDSVIHLAAESHVDRSIDGPDVFVQTNILGTYTLLQAAREHWRSGHSTKTRGESSNLFVHVSTDEVFGSLGPTDPAFSETTPYAPHSPYSATKAASDHLARAWGDTFGVPVVVTNCSNNYGPFQFPEKLIPVVILKALRGEAIPVYGTGENIRDWLHVEDHAEALVTVLERGCAGESYNIGGNNEMRNIDLVRLLCSILDEFVPGDAASLRPSDSLITLVSDRPGHDLRYAIDSTKIREELGWSPKHGRESGFRDTVRWYLENEKWWTEILDGSHELRRIGLV